MRREPLGRIVKKWLGQGKCLVFIAEMLSRTPEFKDITPEECYYAYNKFMGSPYNFDINSTPKTGTTTIEYIRNAITHNKPIHIYGSTGVGKTFFVKDVAEELDKELHISYARSEEYLAGDFGDGPFQISDSVFLLEGDGYYWKKYGLIKNYIENSKVSFIIITIGRETPTKNVTKLLQQLQIYPPTRSEILGLMRTYNPDLTEFDLEDVYDKDYRKVWMKLKFGTVGHKKAVKGINYDAKTMAYNLAKGKVVLEDFDRCTMPISWVLNWLGYNAHTFWSSKTLAHNLEIISWADANKYNFKEIYIKQALMGLIPSTRKGYMSFPPFKKEDVEKIEDKKYILNKFKKSNKVSPMRKKKETAYEGLDNDDELGDFMMV